MNRTVTQTIELTAEEIKLVLAIALGKKFNGGEVKVDFIVSDTSDDRYGHSPSYALTGARVTGKATVDL